MHRSGYVELYIAANSGHRWPIRAAAACHPFRRAR